MTTVTLVVDALTTRSEAVLAALAVCRSSLWRLFPCDPKLERCSTARHQLKEDSMRITVRIPFILLTAFKQIHLVLRLTYLFY